MSSFENDKIAECMNKSMAKVCEQMKLYGMELHGSTYNRIFEAIYNEKKLAVKFADWLVENNVVEYETGDKNKLWGYLDKQYTTEELYHFFINQSDEA